MWGPEHLLSALEACGVDNARIEVRRIACSLAFKLAPTRADVRCLLTNNVQIEGGRELPIIEGSALGWCGELQKAGLREAPATAAGAAPKTAPALQEVGWWQGGGFGLPRCVHTRRAHPSCTGVGADGDGARQ